MSARVVWSTADGGQVDDRCPRCAKSPCGCRPEEAVVAGKMVSLRLESGAKRGGKTVTVLDDLPYNTAFWKGAVKTLKAKCSCGGAWKDGVIELQGDHRDKVAAWLEEQGFSVKRK